MKGNHTTINFNRFLEDVLIYDLRILLGGSHDILEKVQRVLASRGEVRCIDVAQDSIAYVFQDLSTRDRPHEHPLDSQISVSGQSGYVAGVGQDLGAEDDEYHDTRSPMDTARSSQNPYVTDVRRSKDTVSSISSSIDSAPGSSPYLSTGADTSPNTDLLNCKHVVSLAQAGTRTSASDGTGTPLSSSQAKRSLRSGLIGVEVVSLKNGMHQCTLKFSEVVETICFSPAGQVIVSGGAYDVCAYGLKATDSLTLGSHDARVKALVFAGNSEKVVASGSSDCTVRLWDLVMGGTTGAPLRGECRVFSYASVWM